MNDTDLRYPNETEAGILRELKTSFESFRETISILPNNHWKRLANVHAVFAIELAEEALGVTHISSKPLPASYQRNLYTTRQYPCGCKAAGPGDVPNYCSTHGSPPNSIRGHQL